MVEITQEFVRKLFEYDAETGVFTRRVASGKTRKGQVAGGSRRDGYVRICVNGKKQYAHRLAWLYVTGEWPAVFIDHIDGNPSNNAIANLRPATSAENQQNRRRSQINSSTGILGVSPYKEKFRAVISKNGAFFSVGVFGTKDQAGSAYLDAKRRMHEFSTI